MIPSVSSGAARLEVREAPVDLARLEPAVGEDRGLVVSNAGGGGAERAGGAWGVAVEAAMGAEAGFPG